MTEYWKIDVVLKITEIHVEQLPDDTDFMAFTLCWYRLLSIGKTAATNG